jgi:hypothetical protein
MTDPTYLSILTTATPPLGIPAAAINNPNLILQTAIAGQNIVETIVLDVSTDPSGGIINIPFVKTNASPVPMSATFWIEKVKNQENGIIHLQLQYTQTAILSFWGLIGLMFPLRLW